MPHEIESDDSMFSGMGITPWHGLGTVLEGRLTAEEALAAASLSGWNLTKKPVWVKGDPDGYGDPWSKIPRFYAVVRETDGKPLGIVQDRYRIVQNEEAFDWANFLVGGDGSHFETAGSLRGGRIVFLTIKTPFDVDLPGGDKLETFLLVTNRHDGSGGVVCAIVTIRVVCKNTLDMALGGSLSRFTIKHTVSAEAKLGEAQRALGLAQGAADRAEAVATKLLTQKMTNKAFSKFVDLLVPLDAETMTERGQRAAERQREAIAQVYHGHPTIDPIRDTAWGAYNSVTFYNDHLTPRREMTNSDGSPAENRMLSIIAGNNIGTRALALLSKDLGGGRWLKG